MFRPLTFAAATGMLVILIGGACPAVAPPTPPTAEETGWLKANLTRIATDAPTADLADLRPVKAMVGGATVVALGEGSHGTREHFRLKHRLTELLVRECGFTHFLIEASGPETERVNDYVQGGPGDVKAVVAGMKFWTWNTEEVAALVEWLRGYNRQAARPVQFLGIDMQLGGLGVADTLAFAAKADPGFVPEVKDAFAPLDDFWTFEPAARKAVAALPAAAKADLARKAWAVAEHLDASRPRYAATLPAGEVERAVRSARVATQAVAAISKAGNFASGMAYRDQCMADNVRHILSRAARGAKAVVWGHNLHVSRQPGWMGHHLAKEYGDKMLAVGFTAGSGTYTAIKPKAGLASDNELAPPPAGSVEERLRAAGMPRAVLDLRAARAVQAGRWATERRPFRTVGAVAMPLQFQEAAVADWFDLLVYVDRTEASRCHGIPDPPVSPKAGGPR